MRDAPQASPREYFRQLKQGYQRYQELMRGGRPNHVLQFDRPRETNAFHRPKIAVVLLTDSPIPSPILIFDQLEHELVIFRLKPGESSTEESVLKEMAEKVEWAFQSNRLRLIVLMAAFVAPKVSWWRRWFDRRYLDLVSAREVIPLLTAMRNALEKKSESIKRGITDGEVAVVEALYDPNIKELYLDISRAMEEKGEKNV